MYRPYAQHFLLPEPLLIDKCFSLFQIPDFQLGDCFSGVFSLVERECDINRPSALLKSFDTLAGGHDL